jgi:hypothetical protein
LNEYLKYKKENKNKVKLKWNEWKDLLFEYCNKNKYVPTWKKFKQIFIKGRVIRHNNLLIKL